MAEKQEVGLGSSNITAGATPVDAKENGRPSTAKQGLHWFGHGASDYDFEPDFHYRRSKFKETRTGSSSWFSEDGDEGSLDQGKDLQQKDREERLRVLRDKQNEERQKKLEELKQQALAAQKFREQKEEERRKRLEELRVRDTDRRHQVEERKRQIWEAERDRREAILRKNQEREARIESKRKNERSSIVFAFGSSTPRMLEPGDTGSTYWAARRATSTTNVMTLSLAPGPLTRRSSERELDGSKKRATSASGVERKASQDSMRMSSSIYEVFQWGSSPPPTPPPSPPTQPFTFEKLDETDGPIPVSAGARAIRRKTDLTPTVPLPRETTPSAPARSKNKTSPAGLKSGEVTPSRPQSSMSQHSVTSNLSAASFRARGTPRKPRPISIAVTGVSERMSLSSEYRNVKPTNTNTSEKPPVPKVHVSKKAISTKPDVAKKPSEKPKSAKGSSGSTPKATPLQSPVVEVEQKISEVVEPTRENGQSMVVTEPTVVKPEPMEQVVAEETVVSKDPALQSHNEEKPRAELNVTAQQPTEPVEKNNTEEQTDSAIPEKKVLSEEEARAEKIQLAKEEARREAEQRLEAEKRAEEERLKKEEEKRKRIEEEQLRLMEEAKKAEELRLQQEKLEAEKKEEEERKKKEEELRLKQEREEVERKAKEEAEKKAMEEAEKLRQEMELRLKKEEEDRQARRKRVEAIMLRTRGKGNTSASTPTKDGEEGEEGSLDEGNSENKIDSEDKSQNDVFLNSERSHSDANRTSFDSIKQNGHHNGSVDSVTQNNVTNSLLDLDPISEPVEQILDLPSGNGKIADPPIQPQFIAFQEKKEPPTVNDLLS